MSEIKLLPCPFCGEEAMIHEGFDIDTFYQVMCPRCFCKTPSFATKKSAVITWNTRKPMERILTRLEDKRTEYEKISEQKYFDMPQACYYKGYEEGYKGAIKICKEEGGIE